MLKPVPPRRGKLLRIGGTGFSLCTLESRRLAFFSIMLRRAAAFYISTTEQMIEQFHNVTATVAIVMVILSSIGLLVGGIGVMNIMLISVTERTQEIGVRKAIGARRADVRLQFLLEAVVLTLVGGTIGILIGAGVSTMVRTLVPSIPATLSYLWVSIGFAISVGVGLFFGYYPANLAANLDPIVCLRYE